jgi:hypothetical protein
MRKKEEMDLHQVLIARDYKKFKDLLASGARLDAVDREGNPALLRRSRREF